MKIGILDESVVKKIAADILVEHPEVINVFVEGTNLTIESNDIDSLIKYLEEEHNLHLIVNGNTYMVASKINEEQSLAQKAAEAGAKASKAGAKATDRAADKTTGADLLKAEEPTDAEQEEEAKKEIKDVVNQGHNAAKDEAESAIRNLTVLTQNLSGDQLNKILENPEVKKIFTTMRKNRDFFAKLSDSSDKKNSNDSIGDIEKNGNDKDNELSLPDGQKIEVRLKEK